ncbi:MAG: hypothetical protein M1827_001099 [Pycnora praestabilis]|nr:MAG: hypothetical protein M1827_001099 [Pycnora praestabilis]
MSLGVARCLPFRNAHNARSTLSAGHNVRWTLADSYGFISAYVSTISPATSAFPRGSLSNRRAANKSFSTSTIPDTSTYSMSLLHSTSKQARWQNIKHPIHGSVCQRRLFHDYFVTHLPSSSLHPDSRSSTGPHHKLPRAASTPHTLGLGPSPAAPPPSIGISREMTVVRIPLRSAKHHFGVSVSRGTRPYNEDTYQAGVIELPAFSRRSPMSLTRSHKDGTKGEGTSADSAMGDPQVFYFGVFDGHGGTACSDYLREHLHDYIEDAAKKFELESSLKRRKSSEPEVSPPSEVKQDGRSEESDLSQAGREKLSSIETHDKNAATPPKPPESNADSKPSIAKNDQTPPPIGAPPLLQQANKVKTVELQRSLVIRWREMVGGYFRRFKPDYFATSGGGQGQSLPQRNSLGEANDPDGVGIETVLSYAYLKADLDFVSLQAGMKDDDPVRAEKALNDGDILGEPGKSSKPPKFQGGSTCSVALISTPTPTPFWHPASPSTLLVAHVGDTRILLCSTANGSAIPLTTNHHPSSPGESSRLRRYAATFVTDSFGEERMSGLANTRAFGDMQSKRIGVSAEPEIRRIELSPAEYSFLVLVSDGISGTLTDQEIVDIVKEARTPDQGAKDVVSFATEVSQEGDNATCLAVRLGGWERRVEGGLGAMGTREVRDWRRQDAADPRRRMS